MGETRHPLDPIRPAEIEAAVALVRPRLTDAARFAAITLEEPAKNKVLSFKAGDPISRRVRLVIVPGPECTVIEATVDLSKGEVVEWTERPGMRPALGFEESLFAIAAVMEHPEWQAAMRKRGITDFSQCQIDPWPAGSFGMSYEDDRRIARVLTFYREDPEDNGYARPVEGVLVIVDMGRGEVLEVIDDGVRPFPPESGSYYPEHNGPLRDDVRPLDIVQPDGPSFSVDDHHVQWQDWSMRLSFDPLEGLVLHTVTYDDGGRCRSVLYRGSIGEMVVPYGDPGPLHGWKNAFDCGEWGLGRMANSLALGCDCLGEITYLDAVMADEQGNPSVVENAICMHEEDYGILWKHQDLHSGRSEVRRSRRLVVSFISTVGNYEYGFYWYFYMDGTIQLEVKLTGILSTQALADGEETVHSSPIAPGLAAPFHQHLFCARLDLDVDGPANEVHEINAVPVPAGEDNPWANAFVARATRLSTESQAQRNVDSASSRHWRIVNPSVTNRLGRPVGYKLLPEATPTLLASPSSSVGRRATFATKNLWVTPYAEDERRPAGNYPNQHEGGDGLPRWTAADRSLVDTDVVVWHTFGVTHIPRPEDWPVMPVEYCGFSLIPVGFFERNPALDLPPPHSCHS